MNDKLDLSEFQLSQAAQRALENYPRLAPSPDFNARVLARVLAAPAPSRLEVFCDKLDEIFARPILKLVGVASLSLVLTLLGTNLLTRVGHTTALRLNEEKIPGPVLKFQSARLFALEPDNRFTSLHEFELSLLQDECSIRFEEQRALISPEKNLHDSDSHRSSQCPAAFRSSV